MERRARRATIPLIPGEGSDDNILLFRKPICTAGQESVGGPSQPVRRDRASRLRNEALTDNERMQRGNL